MTRESGASHLEITSPSTKAREAKVMKRMLIVAAAAALTILPARAAADEYPTFATPNGVAANANTPGALATPPLAAVPSYAVPETPADPVADPVDPPPGNFKHTLWGYEAAITAARILQYTVIPGVVPGPTCVPSHKLGFTTSQNGRGMAFDPLDGNLWNTSVSFPGFNGDGFIHKNTPPPTCAPVTDIPFADGPGGTVQDDIGAIDVDEATKHLWVAGYKPVLVTGVGPLSYIYKVNRNTGKVIDSCAIPFRGGGLGNDTLAVYRNSSLPGSSKYLLTDAGEDVTVPNSYALIDQSDCHQGQVVTPIMEFPKTTPGGVTGIDMEWPGLLASNFSQLYDHNDQPFAVPSLVGNYGNTGTMEDISLCAFRGAFGGDGNDMCPYP
jgi:hypothetical protein